MLHVSHTVKVGRFNSIVFAIVAPDTNAVESAINPCSKLRNFDLEELWFISSHSQTRNVVPIHDLDSDLADPLTGYKNKSFHRREKRCLQSFVQLWKRRN